MIHRRFSRRRPALFPIRIIALAFYLAAAAVAGNPTAAAPATGAAKPAYSAEPPAFYRKTLAPLLTPAESALAGAADLESRRRAGFDGSTLLSETLHWVADDGAVWRVEHNLYRANTEAAVEALTRSSTSFRPSSQKIYLALARTLPPGGEWQPVRPDAAFVQSPQDEQDDALYSDRAELVLVFPQIKVGSITEEVVVIEEPVFRIPGEWTALLYFNAGWPMDLSRQVVELPQALAERLADTPIGAAPAKRRGDLANGRVRFEWRAANTAAWRGEPSMAPFSVTGPAVWLTTLDSWDELADWYRGLLAGRLELPAELAAQAREWTAGAASPEEVARILHRHVADEIRYTGLEFGIAGFQPKTPAEVWSNGYGDCKDKANLLRALLASRGISSTLALINTRHAGAVETRSPDFRQFNHAILAIETGRGPYLWADPTIPFLDPGQLGSGDAERPAFLVPEQGGWRFATTPAAIPARLEAAAEVTLGAGGQLEGWLKVEADRFYAASYREFLQGDERHRLRAAGNLTRAFFDGAEVVDVAVEDTPRGLFRAKIYFQVGGAGEGGEAGAGESLAARDGGWLETALEQQGDRRSTFQQVREILKIDLRYRLPPGFAPRELPAPFAVEVPALAAAATWTCDSGMCRVELRQENRRTLVPPADFPAFLQAKKAFDAWLRRPVQLAAGTTAPPAAAAAPLADFPLMPTGAGQLRLLETKFPPGFDDGRRAAALQQVLQWFPNDQAASFEAQVLLGSLECEKEEGQPGAERLRRELARFRDVVPPADHAWGRFVLAVCEAVADEESLTLLRGIADDTGAPASRRARSLLVWEERIAEKDSAAALALVERALALPGALAEDEDLPPLLHGAKTRLLAQAGSAELDAAVTAALAAEPAKAIATRVASGAYQLDLDGQSAAAARLSAALTRAAEHRAELAPVLEELAGLLAGNAAAGLHQELAGDLGRLFAATPPPWWNDQPLDRGTDRPAAAALLDKLEDQRPRTGFVRQAVHYLTSFAGAPDFSERLFSVAWVFVTEAPEAPQLDPLLALLARLPKSDEYYWEGQLLAGRGRIARGDLAGAIDHYRRLAAAPGIPAAFVLLATSRLGDCQLDSGDFAAAARTYAGLDAKNGLHLPKVIDSLLRATLLELESGRPETALGYLRLLRQAAAKTIESTDHAQQIQGLLALAADEAAARAYWRSGEPWWPGWLEIEKKAGLEPRGGPLVPLLGEIPEQRSRFTASSRRRDTAGQAEVLRLLAHGARWDPAVAIELAPLLATFGSARQDLADLLREQAIRMLMAAPPAADLELRGKSYLMLAALQLDGRQFAECRVSLESFAKLQLTGVLPQRAALLAAVAALTDGEQREPAAAELARRLDDSFPADARGTAVEALAELYRRSSRPEEEIGLLDRELKHPAIAGTPLAASLAERREARKNGAAGDLFARTVAAWRARFALPFLEYAEPASLDDPRLRHQETAKLLEDEDWLAAERFKIALLAAADPLRPVGERAALLAGELDSLQETQPGKANTAGCCRRS